MLDVRGRALVRARQIPTRYRSVGAWFVPQQRARMLPRNRRSSPSRSGLAICLVCGLSGWIVGAGGCRLQLCSFLRVGAGRRHWRGAAVAGPTGSVERVNMRDRRRTQSASFGV